MEYLRTHKTHPTAETIFANLRESVPTLSKTTVYNTLSLLVERGAVLHLDIDPKQRRYDGDTRPHVHFWCRHCDELFDLPWVESAYVASVAPAGFTCEDRQLYLKGICPTCQQKSNE